MPYVALPLLEAAVEGLRGRHPLAVIVVPTMTRVGVTVAKSPEQGTPYGSGNEVAALKDWFQIPGAPPGRPFRAVWEENEQLYWRDDRYPGRGLQRIRTDRVKNGRGFYQKTQHPKDLWALREKAGSELAEGQGFPVRIVDLAVWYGREQDVSSLDQLIEWFRTEFKIDQTDLIGTVFDESVPNHYRDIPLSDEPLSQSEYADATGSAPAPVSFGGSVDDLVASLEECLVATRFISTPGLVSRVVRAWARGDVVVLVGLPGTGKTKFAYTLSSCLRQLFPDLTESWVPIRPDFDEADLIGYERLDGSPELRSFAETVLQSEQPLGVHFVVLEEFNLAQVDTYLAPVLIAAQEPDRRVALPAGGEARLPQDTFILATCNSYLDEPESRFRLSFATKRRTSTISMPNAFFERYQTDGNQAIVDISIEMIQQEKDRIEERIQAGLGSALDLARKQSLGTVVDQSSISKEAWERWTDVCVALLSTPEGQAYLTIGLVRDVALALGFAQRTEDAEMESLGRAYADNLVHQLRGSKIRADQFLEAVGEVPNRDEIARLLDRMKSGPGDELIPLV
jgi:hypothetical protein